MATLNRNNNEEQKTLEAGLDFWGKQEQKFKSLFGQEALKDKSFLKMKLRYYDRLWYKYKNAPLSIEGQLLRNMLRFQRNKIERSIKRGQLRKVVQRISIAFELKRTQKIQRKAGNISRQQQYNQDSPKPEMPKSIKVNTQKEANREEPVATKPKRYPNKATQRKFYSYNYNPSSKKKRKAGKRLHQ